MTLQDIFDKAWKHAKYNGPSLNMTLESKFRGQANARCLGGIFIADEDYEPEMDEKNYSFNQLYKHKAWAEKPSLKEVFHFRFEIAELQAIHDLSVEDYISTNTSINVYKAKLACHLLDFARRNQLSLANC